jgi:hypothetical protein
MGRAGRGDSDRPARGEQWVSALLQASMPEGAEQDEPCVEYRRCACCRQESLRRRRAESEGRGAARRRSALRCRPGTAHRVRCRRGGRGQIVPVREGSDQKDLIMGLT